MCILKKALYGHPDAGGHWEKHAEDKLKSVGFTPVPSWPSCFYHKRLKLSLAMYVDDFKLSGPSRAAVTEGWKLIKQHINIDPPHPVDKFIGCDHQVTDEHINGKKVRMLTYDMTDFIDQCVSRYCELTKTDRKSLKRVPTPFLDIEDEEDSTEGGELSGIALKGFMKILYAARMVRYDLLKPVSYLASGITKWSKICDRKLLRLVS